MALRVFDPQCLWIEGSSPRLFCKVRRRTKVAWDLAIAMLVARIGKILGIWTDVDISEDEYANVEWDGLGFGLVPTDYMYMNTCRGDQQFGEGQVSVFGNIQVSPSAGVLNYGQGLFEGTKAYRKENGHLLLFRPQENAIRMQIGAERMCMPSPSVDQFVDALKQTALANRRWVPPAGKGSLYLRPLLIGTGPVLGLAPAPEYTFLVYASPVANYFKEGTAPLNLYVEEEFDRASRRGTGSVKTISNYAPVLKAQMRAKTRGFSDVLYLDSATKKYVEEVSSCNIFIAKGKRITTPATNGTILAGITRKSVIEIAQDHGYEVEERGVAVDELAEADEVFCTGTAVGVAPVGTITYGAKRMEYKTGRATICQELHSTLSGIQTGTIQDNKGWVLEIY
ncbi:branched-chain-amino-acid aminotransferase 2, chloroplastic-like isoform X1 [Senna tora]|uniref:Branched-chain-amino-acid aminotransferase n=1 Tax=Senna tora TaxID=362788 RepID=A0A834T976_9FABA|nr:branched-chain-amino-acid aminotransferase 2, chloroplastic-like isoform X1 [Senna tora]